MIKQMQETSVYYPEVDNQTKKSSLTSKARVFLVEDELLVLEDLKERLIQHNYEVVGTATSGNEAIDKIVSSNPDLVIIDVRIEGELDGIEVAIVIQSHFDYPVPVVFLTGSSENAFPYLKVLPDYIYLNKPYQDTILFDAINRALKKPSQERAS
jgi:DNA-binding NarL/FixJ family response regulator